MRTSYKLLGLFLVLTIVACKQTTKEETVTNAEVESTEAKYNIPDFLDTRKSRCCT